MSRRKKSLHISPNKKKAPSTLKEIPRGIIHNNLNWILLSIVITFTITLPAFLSPSNTFVGNGSEDSALVSGYMHALKSSKNWIFSDNFIEVIGWPGGISNPSDLALLTSASSLVTFTLTLLTNSIAAQLLLVTISIVSSTLLVIKIMSMITSNSYLKIIGILFVCLTPMAFQWNSALPILGMNSFFLFVLYMSLKETISNKSNTLLIFLTSILISAWHPYFTFFFIMVLLSASVAYFWIYQKIPSSIYISILGCTTYLILVGTYFVFNPIGITWIGEKIAVPSLQGLFQYSPFELRSRAFINPFVIGLAILGLISIFLKSNKDKYLERVIGIFSIVLILECILLFGVHSIFGLRGPSFYVNYFVNGLRNGQYAMSLVQIACGLLAMVGLNSLYRSLVSLKLRYLWRGAASVLVASFFLFLSLPTINGVTDRWMVRPSGVDWHEIRSKISVLEPGPILVAPFEVNYGTDGVVCQFVTDRNHPLVNMCGVANAASADSLITKIHKKKSCEKFSFAKQQGVKYIILWAESQNQLARNCIVQLEAKQVKKFKAQDITIFQF